MEKGVQAWTGNTTVHTKCGAIKGFEDQSGTRVWKAIPFARPPVGDLRWKAPPGPCRTTLRDSRTVDTTNCTTRDSRARLARLK